MNYHYYQKDGGNEPWKPVREDKLDTIDGAMFLTILSVSSQPSDGASRDELAAIKYKGPFYVDLDDASSPASTAVFAKELISKLEDKDVFPAQLEIYASGGKGFHVIVPEECFLNKPPKGGMTFLPSIYKEMAFELAVESMDFRVYTARKGRMFRLPNVQRPNGLYKVRISYDELCLIAELSETAGKEAAEAEYKRLCSQPRRNLDVPQDSPNEASGLMALFDACKAKVSKGAQKARKRKPVDLPQELPSFEALLRGEGLKDGLGFHQIAMQVAITAHAKSMTCEDLLAAADGLCQNHESDGYRYNTPAKRRAELARMWEYTDDNPCYEYSSHAITGLLNHTAADLHGIALTPEEVEESIAEGLAENTDEYGHANIIMTKDGAFALTEAGNKKITAVSFENATELVSAETNQVSVMEADVLVGGVKKGRHTFELDTFNSVSNLNKVVMRFGQSFSGNDTHARGMYMRLVEKARKGGRRMYVINREGLDYVSIPFHEDERLRKGFMVWSDSLGVSVEPSVEDSGIKMRFVGYPDPLGQFQTDLSDAPNLAAWVKEGENKYQLGAMLKNLLYCQNPAFIGKLLGWSVACHYRMLFHALHGQFPMLHINGPAGMGKSLRKGTLVIKADGTRTAIENIKVGDKLLGPDGGIRNVLSLGRGQETMYEVMPVKGESYFVNESHILSLRRSSTGGCYLSDGTYVPPEQEILNVNVKVWSESKPSIQKMFKGYRAGLVEFHREAVELPMPAYILGVWLGDGNVEGPTITKPESKMVQAWKDYAETLGHTVSEYKNEARCTRYAIVAGRHSTNKATEALKSLNLLNNKHIPEAYLCAPAQVRMELLAGMLDSDGHQTGGGYDWICKDKEMAEDFTFLCRSLGFAAYMKECTKTIKSTGFVGTYYRVGVSGDCERIPCKDKPAPKRKQVKDHLVTGLSFKKLEVEDYYGVVLDGDHLFLLGDFTVTHNTQMALLFSNLHYYKSEPKMLSPSSTLFAVGYSASASSSIPLVLDEFKPSEMPPHVYDRFKLMLRDAYNCRAVERGGGTRDNADYRSVHKTQLSAPICFIAEAAESESALMERVVLLTLVKPDAIKSSEYFVKFTNAKAHRELLGMIGKYISAQVIKRYGVAQLAEEFNPIYAAERKALMLQPGETDLSPEEYRRKSGAKERTVYNYSVVKFGITKFRNLIESIYGDEFKEVFELMLASACDSMDEIQSQTIPEWLKVMNTFADMARISDLAPYYLQEGKDYAYVQHAGKACFELYASSAYFKYRAYCGAARIKPLYPSQAAFGHALNHIPALVLKGDSVELQVPGGSHVFDLAELRAAGFILPETRK